MRIMGWIAGTILIVIAALAAWAFYTNPARDQSRLQETGFNSHFTATQEMSFQDYVTAMTTQVREARQKAHVDASAEIVAENSPAVYMPADNCKPGTEGKYKNGILLVHGLFDSAYPMQELGKFFQSQCFVVYVILLPGHGTVPGDLLQTTYHDWIKATHFGAEKLKPIVNNLYLGGFSDGGLLVINEALSSPTSYAGLFLFAPALKLKTKLAPFITIVYAASKVIPRFQWWTIERDTALLRYESVPINPVYQTKRLMAVVAKKRKTTNLLMPIFAEQSTDDETIDPTELLKFFHEDANPFSHLLWYYGLDDAYPLLRNARIQVINSYLEHKRVLSMSHLSMTLSEDDKVYGINGSYKDCLMYAYQSPDWQRCNSGEDIYYSEVMPQALKEHIIRRITFNPFYHYLTESIKNFINNSQHFK